MTDAPEPLFLHRLAREVPALSALYFGLPVYLVGGALTDPDPRDLDVVVILPDDLFVACYGDGVGFSPDEIERALADWCRGTGRADPPAIWRRWARDVAKVSERLTRSCARRVDFKTQWSHQRLVHESDPKRVLWPGFGANALQAP